MPVSRPSLDTIYQRMKADAESRLTNEVKISNFSLTGILLLVFAGAIHLCYGMLVWFGKQLFPDTSTKEYLERDGKLKKVFRKEATYSVGVIVVSGTTGIIIPEGTLFQNSNGVQYETDNEATISGGVVNIPVTSTTIGLAGNINDTETELNIVLAISGVDSNASIYSGCDNGADTETDEQLRRRVLYAWANPPAGGRDSDYKQWAWSITGIDKVWVKSAYAGPGTVAVVVADNEGYPVSDLAKTNAQNYIDTENPLGVVAVVENVTRNTVKLYISITPNNSSIRNNITSSVEQLFLDESEPGVTFKLSRLRTAIGKTGVDDFVITQIKVNNVTVTLGDIPVTGFNYLVFDTIVFADL